MSLTSRLGQTPWTPPVRLTAPRGQLRKQTAPPTRLRGDPTLPCLMSASHESSRLVVYDRTASLNSQYLCPYRRLKCHRGNYISNLSLNLACIGVPGLWCNNPIFTTTCLMTAKTDSRNRERYDALREWQYARRYHFNSPLHNAALFAYWLWTFCVQNYDELAKD